MKFCFGDIVVVEENLIGVVVKCWASKKYEVYVRNFNSLQEYNEKNMQRYMVRHKYLNAEEIEYQNNAMLT